MRARLFGTLILCAVGFGVPATTAPQAPQGANAKQNGPSPSHVRVVKLKPTPHTEVTLDETFLASDGVNARRLIMSGPLSKGELTRLFWVIDTTTNEYHILRLTDNHGNDAKRIQRLYEDFGYQVSEPDLANQLIQDSQVQSKRFHDFNDYVRDMKRQAGQPQICGGESSEEGGQYTLEGRGNGYSQVQTWEPAKYYFPVDHLNETWTRAFWTHDEPSGYFPVNTDGFCWANPDTFAGTHWFTTYCSGVRFTPLSHGFDQAITGQYINADFMPVVFNWYTPRAIIVSSTASVQFVNGMANWGADYYEDGQDGWIAKFERWLITGQIAGTSYEYDCFWFCDPPQYMVDSCISREPSGTWYWDYNQCDCLGGASPIIVDLSDEGINLTNAASGVTFDILANGEPVKVAWTRGDSQNALLALDRNHNGTIDSGSELFGNVTPQPASPGHSSKKDTQPNGFLALSVFDDAAHGGNGDGQITEDDAIYRDLRLWIDANHDGVSQPAELKSLADAGVRAISLHYTLGKKVDEFGNKFEFKGFVTLDNDLRPGGSIKRRAIDVFLTFEATH